MAKLYRNAATNEYYTETALDGEFVTLGIHPDGVTLLNQDDVQEGDRIPAEQFLVLEEKGWLTAVESPSVEEPVVTETMPGEPAPVVNESETNAPPADVGDVSGEPLPSVKLPPRPWAEQENVQVFKDDADTTVAGGDQAGTRSGWSQADRENADALNHPEAAAFVGGVWFWLLVVIAMVIVVWGAVELF